MGKISEATDRTIGEFQKTIEDRLKGCLTLAGAAQRLTEIFYEAFRESVVLVRVFATIPFAETPAPIRSFASTLASSKGYITGKNFFILIVFTRENLGKDHAERFIPLAGPFKIATFGMVSQGRIFV